MSRNDMEPNGVAVPMGEVTEPSSVPPQEGESVNGAAINRAPDSGHDDLPKGEDAIAQDPAVREGSNGPEQPGEASGPPIPAANGNHQSQPEEK